MSIHTRQNPLKVKAANLKSKDMKRNPKKSAQHINRVFSYFHYTRQALTSGWLANPSSKSKASKSLHVQRKQMFYSMRQDLDKAAYGGYYDLMSVYKRLTDNKKVWSLTGFDIGAETQVGNYFIPTGIYNFEQAMGKRGMQVGKQLQTVYGAKGVSGYTNEMKSYARKKEWETIGKNMKNFQKVLDNCPQAWTVMSGNIGGNFKHLNLANRWIRLACKTHDYLTVFKEWELKKSATKERIVADVASLLVKRFIPIFGEGYAEVIRGVPNALEWARKIARKTDNAINLHF